MPKGAAGLLADLILPPRCGLCGEFLPPDGRGELLCGPCRHDLGSNDEVSCFVCGGVLSGPEGEERGTCRECLEEPPPFVRAASAALFQGRLAQAVRDFKYRRRVELARVLGLIAAEINWPASFPDEFDLIIPVPLHVSRVRARGFNQAVLICRGLSGRGPVERDLLVRTRETRPQVELDGRARQENVRDAFALSDPERVRGKTVLLVDDVVTTGATCRECARVLAEAGARRVFVRSIARAVGF